MNILNKKRKTFFLVTTLFVFILGIFLGFWMSESELSQLEMELQNLHLDLRSINERIQFAEVFEEDICEIQYLRPIRQTISETAGTLVELEQEERIDTERYDLLKQRHNINQVLFYSELKRYKDLCGYDRDVILFFFNSEEPEISDKQGRELDILVSENGLTIISMDYNYTERISYFYEYYDVKELPALIINYNTTVEGFRTAEEIRELLN